MKESFLSASSRRTVRSLLFSSSSSSSSSLAYIEYSLYNGEKSGKNFTFRAGRRGRARDDDDKLKNTHTHRHTQRERERERERVKMGNALSSSEMREEEDEEEEKKQRRERRRRQSNCDDERYQRLLLSLKRNQNRLFLSGEVTRVNEVTKNGRIFTPRAMARAVGKLELPAFGRLEHPKCPDDASDAKAVERYRKEGCGSFIADAASSSTTRMMDAKTLDDMRVSHVVHDLYFNGNAVVVLVEVLECTEAGRKVREAYEKTGNLVGASMRAWGSSTEAILDVDWGGGADRNGKDIRAVCEEDFELITVDLVANPSHALAYLKPHLGKLGN